MVESAGAVTSIALYEEAEVGAIVEMSEQMAPHYQGT